jgi:hypothetical protein
MNKPVPTPRTSLEDLSSLSSENVVRLRALKICSVEALSARLEPAIKADGQQLEFWQGVVGLRREQVKELGKKAEEKTSEFRRKSTNLSPIVAFRGALPPAGIVAERGTLTRVEPLLAVSRGLPEKGINFSDQIGPVRNQGRRGTCVAHALCALREFHSVRTESLPPSTVDYSEQYLYWWCKENDGLPTQAGTYLKTGCSALQKIGVCEEKVWPYVRIPVSGNEGQGPPPSSAETDAKAHLFASVGMLPEPQNVASLVKALKSGRVVAVSVQTYPFWTDAEISTSGQVSLPLGESPSGGHAILLVGFDPVEEVFIFRNSWDDTWAHESVYGPGHGSLPYQYIRQDAWECCC